MDIRADFSARDLDIVQGHDDEGIGHELVRQSVRVQDVHVQGPQFPQARDLGRASQL